MLGALEGFSVIWAVIGLGFLLARFGLVDNRGQAFLSGMSFLVASPALLFRLVAEGDTSRIFSRPLVVTSLAILVAVALHWVASRLLFTRDPRQRAMATMAAAYTNAGNLGLPIAAHLLGDMTWMAPLMLIQVAVFQPIVLAILDGKSGRFLSVPFRNPITVGILLGLVVNLTGLPVPQVVMDPIEMVGDMAVPMMLLAFGVSLHLNPVTGVGEHTAELVMVQTIKLILHPLAAIGLGMVFGLQGIDLLAVAVLAGLPTAQNVFIISSRYGVSTLLSRDSVFWSTILSVATITPMAALIG